MTPITNLSSSQVKTFLLKSESYAYFDLPPYFRFDLVIDKVVTKLGTNRLSNYYDSTVKPKSLDDVNYKIMGNKDGKYDWRPFQLIHPALYVWLVNIITSEGNWQVIQDRFNHFSETNLVECKSIPVASSSPFKSDKAEQILQWWLEIEQKSIELGLDYDYLFQTDIANCYGSIYTHSIAWAIHTREVAKREIGNYSLIGNQIDKTIQDMCCGQTNGIPQGSVLMDLIAELVLGYADEILTQKIIEAGLNPIDFKIIRYRDDYRIFSNKNEVIDQIVKLLTESLIELGLRLNNVKTNGSKKVITNSLKEDKRYWLQFEQTFDDLYKELQVIHGFSEKYPNSGTLSLLLSEYQKKIEGIEEIKSNLNVMISYIVDIAFKNPRTYSVSMAILSKFLSFVDEDSKEELVNKIKLKFSKIPNTGLLEVWLQRALVRSNQFTSFAEPLCMLASNEIIPIWNSTWLNASLSSEIKSEDIIDTDELTTLSEVIDSEEVQLFMY